jgi:small subunit ribosomal protein S19
MARSVWKGPFVDGYLAQRRRPRASGRNEIIRTGRAARRSCRSSSADLRRLQRPKFLPVQVNENMVGHSSEFSPTRTFTGHPATSGRGG